MNNTSWPIYWLEYSSNAYLYGSEIEYLAKNNVHFKNNLMPPGTVIKEWYSMTNYQASRTEPSLPIIDGESHYHIKIDVETPDGKGCLVRLVFLDRYEREAGDFTIRGKEADFSCPLKTYSYKMQLINGGMTEFTYHSITIEEIE
ncbi:accessory Sec system protein Asp3 [Pseudobutyrivibrio ruminis]|uniref:accessory Sec system protein Asp3 n=1 Tax=Pseudobutyrivibrio ruminis TaxID=46206 RepID=UPI000400B8BE|nr:accessory Sec system protein Asp3 [Pseudobutyrivibrio ruminis]